MALKKVAGRFDFKGWIYSGVNHEENFTPTP